MPSAWMRDTTGLARYATWSPAQRDDLEGTLADQRVIDADLWT